MVCTPLHRRLNPAELVVVEVAPPLPPILVLLLPFIVVLLLVVEAEPYKLG